MAKVKTTPKFPKLISIIDSKGRPDIPYILGKMIADTFRVKVLLMDNSENLELYRCMPKSDGIELKRDGSLYVMDRVDYSEEFFARFDCCICYHGSVPTQILWEKSDRRLALTGYKPIDTEIVVHPYTDDPEGYGYDLKKDCVFFLDKVTGKVKAENILKKYKLWDTKEDLPIAYVELDFDERDHQCLLSLLYNGCVDGKNTGKELYSAITGLVSEYTGVPLAELRKIRR